MNDNNSSSSGGGSSKNVFDIKNINHLRCVRDVEMEMRVNNNDNATKFKSPPDEYNTIRCYVRDVLSEKINDVDVKKTYDFIINTIKEVTTELQYKKI